MSSEQTLFVIALFGAVIIFSVVILTWSARKGAAKRRAVREAFATGPAGPSGVVPTDPWRRFSRALAAPYPRVEERKRGRSKTPADKLYFGYAIPGDEAAGLLFAQALRRDWGVDSMESARQALYEVDAAATADLAGIFGVTARRREEFTARLVAAGVPESVANPIAAWAEQGAPDDSAGPVDRNRIAFDIGRRAHLIRSCAVLGHVPERDADQHLDMLAALATVALTGWDDYGIKYLAGLKARFGSDRSFTKAVNWLTTDPASPWMTTTWAPRR